MLLQIAFKLPWIMASVITEVWLKSDQHYFKHVADLQGGQK